MANLKEVVNVIINIKQTKSIRQEAFCCECIFDNGCHCYHKTNLKLIKTHWNSFENPIKKQEELNKNNDCKHFIKTRN